MSTKNFCVYLHSHDDPGAPPAELPGELHPDGGVSSGHQHRPAVYVAAGRAGAALGQTADEEEQQQEHAHHADHQEADGGHCSLHL